MRQFATTSDVPAAIQDAFADLSRKLREAHGRVIAELKTAVYDVDENGDATDPDVIDALRDAVVLQLEFWAETGDSTGAAAQSGGGSIGAVSLPSGRANANNADKQASRYSPAVRERLRTEDAIKWRVSY